MMESDKDTKMLFNCVIKKTLDVPSTLPKTFQYYNSITKIHLYNVCGIIILGTYNQIIQITIQKVHIMIKHNQFL